MASMYILQLSFFLTLTAFAVALQDVPSYTTECVQLNGTLSLNVTYLGSDNKTTSNFVIDVGKDAKATSICSNSTSTLTLSEEGRDLVIDFKVNLNTSDTSGKIKPQQWGVTKISYSYSVNEPDALISGPRNAMVEGNFFISPVNKSYSCSREMVKLTNVSRLDNGTIVSVDNESVFLNQTHLAIRVGDVSPRSLYDYQYCSADQKVKDIVPIAVGVALAALVVIVLVSYLIGRRRTVSAGGYERV